MTPRSGLLGRLPSHGASGPAAVPVKPPGATARPLPAGKTVGTTAQSSPAFLYAWLLIALFVEYARPTNQLGLHSLPFFYSAVPMLLLLVQSFAPGLRPMKEILSDRISKWLLLFVGIVFLSWGMNAFDAAGSQFFQMMLGYIVLFFLVARIVTSETRLRGVVVALALAHFYLLAVNFNVLTNPSVRQYISGGTFLGDGNDFSLSMCILIPLMIEVGLSTGSRFKRTLTWAAVALIVLAIIATQSRGGTLGIAAVMAYLWWRSPKKAVAAVAIAMVAGLVLLYAPSQYFQRIGSAAAGNLDGSAQGRLDAWSGAIGMGAQNPILGVGPGRFSAVWGKTAHSTYMLALAELGVPGFACVLMLVFGNIHSNVRMRKAVLATGGAAVAAGRLRTMRLLDMTSAAAVGFSVSAAFLSATYYPHMYVLTALMLSARTFAAQAGSPEAATTGAEQRIPPGVGSLLGGARNDGLPIARRSLPVAASTPTSPPAKPTFF